MAYLGQAIEAENLLYHSDSALLNQVIRPKMLSMLNLAGFGLVAWDTSSQNSQLPWRYHTTRLPVFDSNLRALCQKIPCTNLLAHIRGVPTDGSASICEQNLHPFVFPGTKLSMAHNGDLHEFANMRYALTPYIHPDILKQIRGNTDSEWIYAILMSRFEDYTIVHTTTQIAQAVREMLDILREVRSQYGIDISSSVNLFISNPDCIVALRFAFDYGCYPQAKTHETAQGSVDYLSLWFTQGQEYDYSDGEWKMIGGSEHARSIIIASEPLSKDISTWVEVPEYTLLAARRNGSGLDIELTSVD